MAIDWKRLFETNHIQVKDTTNVGWINVCCPFCKDPVDTHFNGGFNIASPRYNCWRCGSHSYYDAVMKLLNLNFSSAKNLLDSFQYIAKVDTSKKVASATHLDLPGFFNLEPQERQYLTNRGYDVAYIQDKFHIRGGGKSGEWAYRILLPVYYNRVLVSWTARSILDRKLIDQLKIPRYKNLSITNSVINPKEVFFNLDNSTQKYVMLVEGAFDVMKIGDNCICSLGTSVTDQQINLLSSRYDKVFIAFDNETSAQAKAIKLAYNLDSVGVQVEVVNPCKDFNKNDPGELTYDEVNIIKKELQL